MPDEPAGTARWLWPRSWVCQLLRQGRPLPRKPYCASHLLPWQFGAPCFLSLDEARGKCEAWRRDYDEVRPHSAIANQVPATLHWSAGNVRRHDLSVCPRTS
jgi:putative transposase